MDEEVDAEEVKDTLINAGMLLIEVFTIEKSCNTTLP
jgi:hypothetical protein